MMWLLTDMWLSGHEKYPNLVADGLPFGITPWFLDIMAEYQRVMK